MTTSHFSPKSLNPQPAVVSPSNCCVVGIGSPHGEDRAGWLVVDRLQPEWEFRSSSGGASIRFEKAAVPHDLLDWLDTADTVHVVDASMDAVPSVRRYEVRANADSERLELVAGDHSQTSQLLHGLRSSSSHQFDLLQVLQLGWSLRRLPRRLVLWTISVVAVEADDAVSSETQLRIGECTRRISGELWCA